MKNFKLTIATITCALSLVLSINVYAQAPPNDLICNATPISLALGCTQSTNVNSTSTGSPAAGSCWAPNSTSNDVWFSFVASVPDITINTDAQGLTLTNTQIAVYSSSNNTCSGTLTQIACDENSGFNVANNNVLNVTLTVGNTYFIRVDGNGTATGTFCISIYDTYTPGSKPCEAQIIHPNNNGTCDIDNGNEVTNATLPAAAYLPIGTNYGGCDDETNQFGTWTTFVANSTVVNVRNTSGGPRDYTFFTGVCTSPTWISCTSVANNATTSFTSLTIGETYYILTTLPGGATTTGQRTDLCATNNVPCSPPANNNCANATVLTENLLYQVTTYCATPDNPPALCSGTLQNNIWFRWTCPTGWTGQAYFQLFQQNCTGGSLSEGTQVSIYNSTVVCGGAANCVATSNTSEDNNLNVVWTPVVGQTYLINYDGYAGEVCNMDFQITNTASVVVINVNSETICSGETVTLTATSNATGYLWSTGQTGNSITVSPTTTTTYSVTATSGGSGSTNATVTVNPIPNSPAAGSNSPLCSGSTLNLTASSIANATYSWTGPNGFTSSLQNPSIPAVTTAAAGTYSVIATVLDCESVPATTQVVVNQLPSPPQVTSNSPICEGGIINLTATGGVGATFQWTGPNGYASTLQNPTVNAATFAFNGTYSVSQTIQGCTSSPATTQVVVSPIPTTIAGSNSPVCLGGALNLTATTVSGGTYSWVGPNGFTSTQQNPTIPNAQVVNGGSYSVTVTANGCISSSSVTTVNIIFIGTPVASSNSPICAGSNLNLTASTIPGASYSWTGPSGFSSNVQNPSITNANATNSGIYIVTANVVGCTASDPDSVEVTINPIPGIIAGSNTPVCAGGSIDLTATSFPGATYSWTGPNGFTSNQQNPSIANATTAMSGTYTVTSNASGCASTTPATTQVVVVATTPPVAANNGPICSGATLNLTATTIAGASYSWTGPGGFTSTLQNPTIPNATTANGGTYSVVASVNGCSSNAPAATNVIVNPIPGIIAGSNSPLCAGQTLSLTASTFAGATYSWTGPNGFTSTQQNPTIVSATTAASGTYSVVATSSGCNSTQPATTSVTINAIPTAPTVGSNSPICQGGTINLTASSITNANYTWTGPTGFISLIQNPSIPNATTANTGVYAVRATVNGCISPLASTTVIVNGTPTTSVAASNSPVCEGATINLTSTPVADATYSWTGPNGFISSLQNPTITNAALANSGTYSVAIIINGCSGVAATTDVVVNEIPPSPIPSSNSPVCIGGTLLLFASTVPNATYLWTDPIGFTNTNQNPVVPNVTALADGIYTVVSIIDGCVSAPATIDVEITPVPVVSFTSNAPVCAGLPVNFTNTGATGAISYFWDFGAGATPASSTLENPSGIVYATGGTKTVTLTVTSAGCTSTDSQTIVITNAPVANFTSNAPVCFPPGIVTFTNSSVGALSYLWNFGPGASPATSTLANPPSVTYATAGTKNVTLTVNSGGCINATTKTADVGVVRADFTSSVPQNGDGGCVGHGENFYNIGSSGSGASHFWNFGDGATPNTSTDENPENIVYSFSGAKIVTHTVTANACGVSETITQIITINPTPIASFSSTAPVCTNAPIDFTNTGSNGAGFTFVWDFGINAIPFGSTSPSPQGVVYSTSGNKTVALTVTNGFYCVAEITQTILINASPIADFVLTVPTCTDLPVDILNNSTFTLGTDWNWDFGSGAFPASSVDQNPDAIVYLTAGSKTITLTATDTSTGCISVDTQIFNIYQTPTAAFTSNAPQCSKTGIDFNNIGSIGTNWNYTWDFGIGASPSGSTAQNPLDVIYNSGGVKTITFTVGDQNCNTTQTQTITVDESPLVNISSTAPQCTGSSVDFMNSGTTADINWAWDFGVDAIPATANSQNPTGIIYSTSGLKTVTLTATNAVTGCATTATITILIHQSPTASFSSNAPQCENTAVNFTNTGSTGNQWTYIWSLGVGANPATSPAENPSVLYNSSGTKTITFTIADAFCSSSVTQTIDILSTPKSAFSSTAPQCTGIGVDFTNIGTSTNVSWLWDFGPTATPQSSTAQNPSGVVYASSGTKSVILTTTDLNSGCATTASQTFTIYQSPIASFSSTAPQCANTAVDFTNTGSTGGTWNYAWSFGEGSNPSSSSAESVSGVLYSSSGTKVVTFTVSNQNCVQTATQTIVVSSTPSVGFLSTAPRCTGLGVDFTNTGTSAGVAWLWNLGSGATPATSNSQNPAAVIYNTSGVKIVSLTATDTTSGCSVTAVNTFNIYQTPVASFTSNAPQCTNTDIIFTNSGTTGSNWNYSWNFGAGASPATSVAESPLGILYSSAGTKTVTFTINDQNCTNTAIQTIIINPTPVVSFISTAPQCTGLPIDFANGGTTNNTVWAWDFGPGSTPAISSDRNPFGVIYSTAGLKPVTLSATDTTSGCSVTLVNNIQIYQTPIASFTSTAPVCANTAVDFTNTGSTGSNWNYSWNLGAGSIPSTSVAENVPGVIYSFAGVKTITQTISNQYCTNTATQNITINSTPVASFTSTAPQCTGLGIDFTNTGTSSGVTWNWNFGPDGVPLNSTSANQSGVVYVGAGIKTVILTTTDTASGCAVTATNTITVYQTPFASFTSNAPQCANTPVNFTNTGSTGSKWSYNWSFDLGANPTASSSENPTGISYSSSGTKVVTLTINDQFCTNTITQNIDILETPTASFTSTAPQCTDLPVNFTNTGTVSGVTWAWTLGTDAAPATSADQDPLGVVYSSAGIKTVTLTTTNINTLCATSASETFQIYQTPSASFTSSAPQCANVAINFTNTGSIGNNWTYSWTFGSDAVPAVANSQNPSGISYTAGGTKSVSLTISDANCSSTDVQPITIFDLPIADAGVDTTICASRSVQLGAIGVPGNTYNWFPSSTLDNPFVANPLASPIASITNYLVTVVNPANGCSNSDVVTVTMLPSLSANAGGDVSICATQSVQIGAGLIEGQFYSWSPSDGLSSSDLSNPTASPLQTTTYTLVVTDTAGCDAVTDNVTVIVNQLPTANAGVDDTITVSSSVQLIGTGGLQFSWTPVEGLSNANLFNPIASPDSTTQYVLTVTDLFGCSNTDTVEIVVYDFADPIWLPTAFTPDGNGRNDVLYVRGGGFKTFDFSIYNRYGDLIFVSRDIALGWDGKSQFTSDEMPADAYVYKLSGVLLDGAKVDINGLVNLVR